MDEARVKAAMEYLVTERGLSREEAAQKIMSVLGEQREPQGEPTFRQRFAGVMERAADPIRQAGRFIGEGMPGLREELPVQGPAPIQEEGPQAPRRMTGAEVTGQAFGSLLPRTPEGVVLSILPFTKPGAYLMAPGHGAVTRGLSLPVIGGGIAGLTGGGLEDIGLGAIQGGLTGGAAMLTHGVQRGIRRATGREISVRNIEASANLEIQAADDFAEAIQKGARLQLEGSSGADKIRSAPKSIQDAISATFKAMQASVEKQAGTQTFELPTLGWIRGKTKTIPGTPASPIFRPGGQPVTQGTPSQTVPDNFFTMQEGLDFLKNFGAKVRDAQRRAANKGEPMLAKEPGDLNRQARKEMIDAIDSMGDPKLTSEFIDASEFYYNGKQWKKFIEGAIKAGVLTKAGSPTRGGLNQEKLSAYLLTTAKIDPSNFPTAFRAGFRGQSLGARELQRPGSMANQRIYTSGLGFQVPSLSGTRLPLGTPIQVSGMPGRVTGALTGLGTEKLLKSPEGPPAERPDPKKLIPLIAPDVGVE